MTIIQPLSSRLGRAFRVIFIQPRTRLVEELVWNRKSLMSGRGNLPPPTSPDMRAPPRLQEPLSGRTDGVRLGANLSASIPRQCSPKSLATRVPRLITESLIQAGFFSSTLSSAFRGVAVTERMGWRREGVDIISPPVLRLMFHLKKKRFSTLSQLW